MKFKETQQHQEGDIDKHDKVIITIIIRWKHGLKKMKNDFTRGAGEDAIWSWLDELKNKARWFFGAGEVDIGVIMRQFFQHN